MTRLVRNLVCVCLAAAAATHAVAADPGTRWRITTSLSGSDINLPPRVAESCAVGEHQSQPAPAAQNDCKFTELSRDGNTVHYSVHCSTMDGNGDISYAADHYSGKFNMKTPRGSVIASYEGQKLGTCDGTEVNANTAAATSGSQAGANSNTSGTMSTVGSAVKSGVAAGAGEVKDTATEVATDAAQSAKDDAKESVKDKAENALKGLFNH